MRILLPFALALVCFAPVLSLAQEDPSDAVGFGPPAPRGSAASSSAEDEVGFGSSAGQGVAGASTEDEVGFGPGDPSASSTAGEVGEVTDERPHFRTTLTGAFRSEAGVWTKRPQNPIAKLRSALDASLRIERGIFRAVAGGHAEYDAAYLYRRGDYDGPTLDNYELVYWGGDSYLALEGKTASLVVGRQVVAWGDGELLSPVDVVNPRDVREPFLAELDDLRLPTLSTRASVLIGSHMLEFLVVHESWFGLRPPPLAYFSPLRAALLESPQVAPLIADKSLSYRDSPRRWDLSDPQLFARWSVRASRIDAALYAASVRLREGVLELPQVTDFAKTKLSLGLDHPRYELLAHSGATTLGGFVLRWELVYDFKKPINVGALDAVPPVLETRRFDVIEGMLGLTYTTSSELRLTLEAQKSFVRSPPRDMEPGFLWPVEAVWVAGRVSQPWFRDLVRIEGLFVSIGDPRKTGWLVRGEISAALKDDLRLGFGYVTFQPGDDFGPIYGYKNDRFMARIRRDFAMQ